MKCDHLWGSPTYTLVRTHPRDEPKVRGGGSLYDEYECESCHAYGVQVERLPNGRYVWIDDKPRMIVRM